MKIRLGNEKEEVSFHFYSLHCSKVLYKSLSTRDLTVSNVKKLLHLSNMDKGGNNPLNHEKHLVN